MTTTRALAKAGLVVSGAFLISRLLGWIRYVLIVTTLPERDVDTFLAAFRLPDTIFQLVAAGALSSAIIPIVSALLASEEEARAWRVVTTVTNLMLGALLLLGAIILVFAPWLVPAITPGFAPDQLEDEIRLTRIMLLSPIFLALGAMATSVLNAYGRFPASAIAPIVYNLAIIAGTLLLGPGLGVSGVAIAVVLGSLGHLLVQLPSLYALGYRYRPRIDVRDPQARRAFALMAPRAIGLGATQLTFIVVTAVASVIGPGSVTAFNNAFLLLQIPLGVIGVPLGIVVLPSLARDAAAGRPEEYAALVSRALRLLAFVMLPIAGLGIVLRNEVAALLFGHGQISSTTVDATAATLGALLIGLAAHAMIAVLARAFYAQQDTKTPVIAGLVAVAVDCGLAVVLSGRLGLPGIGLAIAIGAWIEAAILIVALRSRVHELELRPVGVVGLRAFVATLFATAAAIALNGGLAIIGSDEPGVVGLMVRISIVSGVGLATYAALAHALRIPELPSIVGVMADLLRHPRRA
ncbi:MAG: murein biosynthesis integral membrane protein MurJ [Chloroflexota bacterium]